LSTIDHDEQQKIKAFYDTVYYKNATASGRPSHHTRQLARQLQFTPSQRVLDVACGTGEFLMACTEYSNGVAGVDLSDKAIDQCKARLPDGEFYACPAETLPFGDDRFDIVTCLGSLEHFLDPVAALKEMVRVAQPAARFVILVPNKDFLTRKLGLYGGTYQVDAMEVVRTLDEWNVLFEAAGLTVLKRWKDLHVLTWNWISANGLRKAPVRALQAMALPFWPIGWQYQVYHLAAISSTPQV